MRFFVAEQYDVSTLLRRADAGDQAFVDGRWQPTGRIRAYENALDRWVTPVSELEARVAVPTAFTGPPPAARPGRLARALAAMTRRPLRQQWDET